MVADKTAKEQKGIPVAVLVVALVIILGAGFFLYLDRASRQPPPPPAPLSSEAKAYTRNLQLMDVDMQKHESYLKQAVVEITGKIGNNGNKVTALYLVSTANPASSPAPAKRHQLCS